MKRIILPSIFMLVSSIFLAQGVGINNSGANPANSAMLDVVATDKGILVPRVALTATNAAGPIAAPATSLLVYNTATAGAGATAVTPGFYYWDGAAWQRFDSDNNTGDWKILGNANTISGINFLGTTNAQALDFRTNNTIRFRIANANQVHAMSNGTAALPFYSWSADPNTGMSNLAADNLSISAGGIETMRSNTTVTSFMREIQTRETNANAGDILVRIYDSADDGIIDIYQNNTVDIRLHANGESYINPNCADNRSFIIGDATALYPTFDVLEAHAINSAGGNNYAVNAYSNGAGDCIYAEITTDGGGYCVSGVNADNTIAGTNTVGIFEYIGTDVDDHIGVRGFSAPAAGWGVGVWGDGDWYGVVSIGDFIATGAKAFGIDHPLDPANKSLMHFCLESNEIINHYRGNVVLDNNGNGIVQLPEYFHEVNINFSYTLTAIGVPAPNLHISEEINADGAFVVSGGTPGQKVSWVVEAERNDLYLRNNPEKRLSEVDKKESHKGTYWHPEEYGLPRSQGILYQENPYEKKQRLLKEEQVATKVE